MLITTSIENVTSLIDHPWEQEFVCAWLTVLHNKWCVFIVTVLPDIFIGRLFLPCFALSVLTAEE